MPSRSNFDYAKPFDIMVGRWSGMTTTFDARGEYLGSVASLVTIYWKTPETLHYEQDELPDLDARLADNPHKAAIARIVRHDFDLDITGKSCTSADTTEKISVVGAETRPGIYLFHLTFPEGHYYNNQYFTNPNERHIIGPFVATDANPRARPPAQSTGEVTCIVAQTFTRISYDVPAKFKRRTRKR
jgi:hypothetical protein